MRDADAMQEGDFEGPKLHEWQDWRWYPQTNVGVAPGLPQTDSQNPGVRYWGGEKIWLGAGKNGGSTELSRLFDLLVSEIPRWRTTVELTTAVYGSNTVKAERLVKLISLLRSRFAEHNLDNSIVIVSDRIKSRYVLLLLQDQKYQTVTDSPTEIDGRISWFGQTFNLVNGKSRQLFLNLAATPGRFFDDAEIERLLYDTLTLSTGYWNDREIDAIRSRIRTMISRLNRQIKSHNLSDRAAIVPRTAVGGFLKRRDRGYSLILLPVGSSARQSDAAA